MGRKMDLVYPWYNLRQPKISLVYLEALVYTRDSLVYAKTRKLIIGVKIPGDSDMISESAH